jgi:glycosyltransferase involved in cell wall biosynthesis
MAAAYSAIPLHQGIQDTELAMETDKTLGVCMIISCFHPVIGGGERQAQQLAARLVERGVDVRVITRRFRSLPEFEYIDGVPVHRVPIVGRGPLAALTFVIGAFRLMAHSVPSSAILHCHQSSLGIAPVTIAVLAKHLWANKVIVKFMGSRVRDMAQTRTWPVRRWLLNQVDAFVATNDLVRAGLAEIGLDVPTHVLPNGVDVRAFCPADTDTRHTLREHLGLAHQGCLVLFVGRLDPVKALDVLLQAWAHVVRDITEPQLTLVLVGDGVERERLANLARELGIFDFVHFAGASDHVIDWYRAADLFVLPSYVEGLSNAMLEAMACELPVVATAVGGTPSAIENEVNGLLIPPGDADAISEALRRLIHHPAEAQTFGQAARQTVLSHYSIDSVVERYAALYTSLVDPEDR